MVIVGIAVFVVLNLLFVVPMFGEYAKTMDDMKKTRDKLRLYDNEIRRKPHYEAQLKQLESSGSFVAQEEQATLLRFHDLLLLYAGNRQLAEVYRRIVKGLHLFRLRGLYSDGAAEMSNAEHALILKAVQVGDAEAAGHTMRSHIEAARLRMRRAVKAASEQPAKTRKLSAAK